MSRSASDTRSSGTLNLTESLDRVLWGSDRVRPVVTPSLHYFMGVLSDRLGARLAEMKARHAETDREIITLKREAETAFTEWQRLADELADELAD